MSDLFGHDAPESTYQGQRKKPLGPQGGKHYVEPRGYGGIPGTGPEGRQCRHCAHYCQIQLAKRYPKCALTRATWTGGRATDILARSPACSRFEEPSDEP